MTRSNVHDYQRACQSRLLGSMSVQFGVFLPEWPNQPMRRSEHSQLAFNFRPQVEAVAMQKQGKWTINFCNGKTARQLLIEQLDLLDNQMEEVAVDLAKNDTQKLLAHGRFLNEKFRKDQLVLAG